MSVLSPRWILAAAFALTGLAPAAGLAQQRPTSAEAQVILRNRPDLVLRIRQRLAASGLTPEQVRARLRAEGYPEDLLDPYLGTDRSTADSLNVRQDVVNAVQALGITDSTDVDFLAPLATGRPAMRDTVDRVITEADSRSDPREIFGLEVFRRETSQFDPNTAGPVDPNYRLGPGDRLVLILTGDVELAHTLDVTREGFVVIPQVGQIHVANLTLSQLEDLLFSRLARVYSGVRRGAGATTRFSISVAGLRTNQIYVVGDVAAPGSYRISSAATAMAALYAAGGPTVNGSMRQVEIRRGGRLAGSLDVYDYLLRGDASKDLRLENGDVVFVPVHGPRVRVSGQVLRPATYEMRVGETLTDVIRSAGGFTPSASTRRIQIERILPPSARTGDGEARIVMDVAANIASESDVPAVPVQGGDAVRVFEVSERVGNRVRVGGNVWTPGVVALTDGMRVSEALRAAGGLRPDTYLGQVLVTRYRPDSSRIQLRTALVDTTGRAIDDHVLQQDDEIQVFSLADFRPTRYVVIAGAVRHGGRFPYREGMTLRDLVLLAGGVLESADLREAEIARLPESRSGGVTAISMRVPLDSTYLVERDGNGGRYMGPPGVPAPGQKAPEVPLLPYDNVLILRQPGWDLERTVEIFGEVTYPGRYSLLRKDERLADVIRRAGGLTSEGNADGIVFYRRDRRLGRIGVDLPAVLRSRRHRDNLIMFDGDSLHIPSYSPVVDVTGAVNSPVAVAYVPGRDLNYYVDAAGGPSRTADEKRAYVTQPNGKVESRGFMTAPEPRPGSVVHVPHRDPNDRKDYVAIAGNVAQVLASLVAIVAIVTR